MTPYTSPEWSDRDDFYCDNRTAAVDTIHYYEYLLRSVLEDGSIPCRELLDAIKSALGDE